jgi:hypothetical protein
MNLKPYLPDVRDLHLYGGALLFCLGLWFWDWRVAVSTFGAFLLLFGRAWR